MLHYTSATAKTHNYSHNMAKATQRIICICCLESSVLHIWVLGTLCKAYLEHTLPGVEWWPVCKVKLQLSISEGQHRLQAGVYRADQPSWRTKASVSSGSSDQHTRAHKRGQRWLWAQQDLFIAPDWAKTIGKHPPHQVWTTAHKQAHTPQKMKHKGPEPFILVVYWSSLSHSTSNSKPIAVIIR